MHNFGLFLFVNTRGFKDASPDVLQWQLVLMFEHSSWPSVLLFYQCQHSQGDRVRELASIQLHHF